MLSAKPVMGYLHRSTEKLGEARTWIQAAARFNFELRVACPKPLLPPESTFEWARREQARVIATDDPEKAIAGADCVVTDSWVSLGFEPTTGDTFTILEQIDPFARNRQKQVVKTVARLRPWRLSASLRGHSVLELPVGTIEETGTKRGDWIEVTQIG